MNTESFKGVLNNENTTNVSFQGGSHNRYVNTEVHLTGFKDNDLIHNEFSEYFRDLKQGTELFYTTCAALQISHEHLTESSFNLVLEGMRQISIEPEELVGRVQDNAKLPKRILLIGETESDKTAVCRMLGTDWAVGKTSNSASQYELVTYLNLAELKHEDEVETAIIMNCQQNASETTDESLSLRVLKHYSDKILLILDGFEKITEQQRNQVLNIIRYSSEKPSLFKKSTILVTSTSNAIEKNEMALFQRHVRLMEHRVALQASASPAVAAPPPVIEISPINNLFEMPPPIVRFQEFLVPKKPFQDQVRGFFSQFEPQ